MEGRVLVVEDHQGNRQLIASRLEADGLTVAEASTGREGLDAAAGSMPQVILVSTSLPDMSGLEVTRRLRQIRRTQHVFVMLLGDEDDRSERLAGLEAGANDFVTHPIDVDLVLLRVRNAIQRANQIHPTDPVTGLPAGRDVQEQLMRLVRDPEGTWALIRFHVRDMASLRDQPGLEAGDELLRAVARLIAATLGSDVGEDDYLGYGGRDDFIVITDQARAADLIDEVRAKFDRALANQPDLVGREGRRAGVEGKPPAAVSLHIHRVDPDDGPFYDIRSLSEALAR